jgi:8-oxo-dGTP pyrophosphatase MutT (NUDIX family)
VTGQALPDLDELPTWLRPLARAARSVEAGALSRFLPPSDGSGRASAVLIAFAEVDGAPNLLLIQRASDMRHHAGQVAFPGGAVDDDDPGRVHTALREAEEEVGLDPDSVLIVAELPPIYLPPSGFVVTPVLAWWTDVHPVAPVDAAEVARVALVPITELAEPEHRFRVEHPSGWHGPGFEVDGLFVWGFTAGLVEQLITLGGWERPWDTTRHRSLPPGVAGRPRPLPEDDGG